MRNFRFSDDFPFGEGDAESVVWAILKLAAVMIAASLFLDLLDGIQARFNPREFWDWLQTPSGRFAEYLAGEMSPDDGPEYEAPEC